MAQKKQKKHFTRTPVGRFFQLIYRTMVAISALIVVLFAVYSQVVRPPDLEKPVAPTLPASQPLPAATDDPATEPDEGQTATPTPTGYVRREGVHTFLLMGTDDGNGNADTIMVVSYDVAGKKVGVVSVPRDTLVDVSRGVKKINAGYGVGGIEQVQREVSTLLGIPVDHYIRIDVKAFKAVVDAVGGVDFYVPTDMKYNDGAGFIIDLREGMQHLDGDHALQLVRCRSVYASADIGRIETQQKFLTAMAKKVLSWSSATKLTEFAKIFSQYVKTDLTVGNLAYFAVEALSLDLETGVSMTTLPGDGLVTYKGIPYYYELFPTQTLEIINQKLNPYTVPITADTAHIFQVP